MTRSWNIFKGRHVIVALFVVVQSCQQHGQANREAIQFQGETMGTSYRVTVVVNTHLIDTELLGNQIQEEVDKVDNLMSNWKENSDISLLNRAPAHETVTVSDHTSKVLKKAFATSELTAGAFDVTMSPLIELWGFGTTAFESFPAAVDIQEKLKLTGPQSFMLEDTRVTKLVPGVTINMSAIAKGYAVDLVHQLLAREEVIDHMIEIGGEVYVAGKSVHRKPWRIGLEAPDFEARTPVVHNIVHISDVGLATSGNYRNYFTYEGQLYTHILDPRTGYPVPPALASVSVIARDCMTADALATAFMVMGPKASLALVEQLSGVECVMVVEASGSQDILMSSGMEAYL